MDEIENYRQVNWQNYTSLEKEFCSQIAATFQNASGTILDKLNCFARFAPRQAIALFLAKHALYQLSSNIHGSIVECGVFMGSGLFTFSQLVSIYEPYNHNRKVIGFDTFAGFPATGDADGPTDNFKRAGGLTFSHEDELLLAAQLHDMNRPIGHLPRIELVKGDARQTIPTYIEENRHLVVSLLYLDFDLFEPTKIALQAFVPRMPKGAVLAFQYPRSPAATAADNLTPQGWGHSQS